MTTITIRNVPDRVRNELAARAARSGRSLQEFMLAEVVGLADKPDVVDWVARVRERKRRSESRATAESILEAVRADRR